MRYSILVTAVTCLWALPSEAATPIQLQVSGRVPATLTTDYGGDSSDWPVSGCELMAGHCLVTTNQNVSVDLLFTLDGAPDVDVPFYFREFDAGMRANVYGEAVYLGNGAYRGLELHWEWMPLPLPFPGYGQGFTDSFSIRQIFPAPVPEPSTWAMMLLGFGLVGGAMRASKRKQKLPVSYA